MYSYFAYGLSINSVLSLPELLPSEGTAADVTIRTGNIEWPMPENLHEGHYYSVDAKEACFFWEEVGMFLVRSGREIIVKPASGVGAQLLRQPLLGTVLAALLYQRGHLVMHASGVKMNTHVVGFLGVKGMGKSTLCAALYQQGHNVVVDDVLALNFDRKEGATVYPGIPQIKLWPDAVASLGEDPEILERLYPQVEKRCLKVTNDFPQKAPFRLTHIYIITDGPELKIEPVNKQEAFIELVRHSFPTRLVQAGGEEHFRLCSAAARDLPLYRLSRPSSLSLLPEVVRMVEQHSVECSERNAESTRAAAGQ